MNKHASKLFFVTLVLMMLCNTKVFSQYYYYDDNYLDNDVLFEVGGSVGTMHGITDVGRKKFTPFLPSNLDFKSTKSNVSFYVGLMYQDVIGARLEITYGSVAGADSNGAYKDRNLSYRSIVNEVSLIGEFHPLMLKYHEVAPRISPYVMGGIGRFAFNPQTQYQGKWVNLKPLRTEGQGFNEYPDRTQYKLRQVCLPFGAGLKYELSPFFNFRVEGLFRYTFTDYLDDASQVYIDASLFKNYLEPQNAALAEALANRYKEKTVNKDYTGTVPRGGVKTNDKYFTMNVKIGLTLGRQRIR